MTDTQLIPIDEDGNLKQGLGLWSLFSIGSVSLFAFRNVGLDSNVTPIPGPKVLAPIAFAISSLVVFWTPWDKLSKTIPIMAIGLLWYIAQSIKNKPARLDLTGGLWLVVYLVAIYIMSHDGTFGDHAWFGGPWDSLIVAAGSLLLYYWGVKAGPDYMKGNPELVDSLRHPDDVEKTQPAPDTAR